MNNEENPGMPLLRRKPRFERSLPVLLHDPHQGLVNCKSTVLNLSEAGLCLETSVRLIPGRNFTFDLHLPNGFPVAGMAECRWERITPGALLRSYGAKILIMDPVSERALNQYIASLTEARPMAYKAASSETERRQAYRLVHDSYVAMKYMKPHPSGLRFTKYNLTPGSATFVAVFEDAVVATMSVFMDGPDGLPIDQVFGPEVRALRAAGRKVAEFGALAHRRANIRRGLDVFLNLCRLAHAYVYSQGIDDILITVNPRHRDLYPKLLQFKAFGGGERSYAALADNPAVAYRLDLREATPQSESWRWFVDHPVYQAAKSQEIQPLGAEEAEAFLGLPQHS